MQSIHFESYGDGDPVMLITGLGGVGRAWGQAVIDRFAGRYFTVVPDHPGTGQSPSPSEGYTIDNHAAAMAPETAIGAASPVGGQGEDLGRQQARIAGPGLSDGQGSHGNAGWHLDDRQQRVEPAQRLALDRHTEHRQPGLGRRHARQVRRTAGPCDDGLQAAYRGLLGERIEKFE